MRSYLLNEQIKTYEQTALCLVNAEGAVGIQEAGGREVAMRSAAIWSDFVFWFLYRVVKKEREMLQYVLPFS